MAWAEIDNLFYSHPKVIDAGSLGVALFACGLSYCSRHSMSGFIPIAQVRRLIDVDNPQAVAERLVAVGLWERQGDGYQMTRAIGWRIVHKTINSSWWKRSRCKILERDEWICQYCGAPAEHVDHIIPRRRGGSDDEDNLVAACARCNLSKGARTPREAGMELRNAQMA